MDNRWTPFVNGSKRQVRVVLHPTASPQAVRDGTSTDGVNVTKLASSITHSQFDAKVKLDWNYSLFSANQPKSDQILEVQMMEGGVFQPIWIGIIDSVDEYTISRGERSLQLIAKSRDSLDILRTTKRVTQVYPQMTDITYIIGKVARNAGLEIDEIVLPPSGFTTAHTNTQLADMSAWDMFEAIFISLGWTPFIDTLGRLRAASRELNRPVEITLTPKRIKRVTAQRHRPPVTRLTVKWLDPILKKSLGQGRKLTEEVITMGWWRPSLTKEIFFSDDRTQRAVDTRLDIKQTANVLVKGFLKEEYEQTGENKGELKLTNKTYTFMIAALAIWVALSVIPDAVIAGPGLGITDASGRRIQAAAQLTFMVLMMAVGTGVYEIWGTPYDWIYARNSTQAFDINAKPWIDRLEEIESDFVANELHAQAIAVRELIYRNKSVNKWRITTVDDPRVEFGDIVALPDGTKFYVENYSRNLTRGAEPMLEIEGFLIGTPGGVAKTFDLTDLDGNGISDSLEDGVDDEEEGGGGEGEGGGGGSSDGDGGIDDLELI